MKFVIEMKPEGNCHVYWLKVRDQQHNDSIFYGLTWPWLLTRFEFCGFNPKESNMKFVSAHYVSTPNTEIYVFVDEEPSGLPEGATEICRCTDVEEFLSIIEPYFVLGKKNNAV